MKMHALRAAALLVAPLMLAADLPKTAVPSPASVVEALKAGNKRYVTGLMAHPHEASVDRRQLTSGQHPRAVILGCADSRVPPEIVFDQGLGDLFTVRVAGNIANHEVLGSVEYAVEHLHTPVIIVLGHEKCGAVGAALHPEGIEGHIKELVDAILPAVDRAKGLHHPDAALLHDAVEANVDLQLHHLTDDDPVVHEEIIHKKVIVIGAVYDLETGRVRFLNSNPLPH
ncbi:MAG: carbonic anhydrase [Acidobacteriota bacterium]